MIRFFLPVMQEDTYVRNNLWKGYLGPRLFLYFGTPPTVCQFAIVLPNSARSIFGKGDTGVSMHLIDAVSEAAIK